MSGTDDSSDKSFEPSQKKLDDARKKGEIARSSDLSVAAAYGGLLIAILLVGQNTILRTGSILSDLLDRADHWVDGFFGGGGIDATTLIWTVIIAVLPLFAIPLVAVILVIVVQRAFVVTPDKIKPKLNRISLIGNAKQKFGRSGLFEFSKSAVKLTIYATILFVLLRARLPEMAATLGASPMGAMSVLARLCVEFLLVVFAIALVIGGADFLWQRNEHLRKNRMSHKEVRDEHKDSEGDPHVKQARRQKAQDIASRRMMQDVPSADVIIVNPTHYAVALKWSRQPGSAPVCVAKGCDEIARRIREMAHENAVPIHSDPPTARALFASTEIGCEISPDHYRAVAAAIRFADALRTKQKGRLS